MWNNILNIIRYIFDQGEVPELNKELDWELLYQICKAHKIEALIYYGFEKMNNTENIPEEILKKFKDDYKVAVARNMMQEFSQKELASEFEKAHIDYLPLKGMLMKAFYPKPELRMMADFDILFQKSQEEQIDSILIGLGYKCIQKDGIGKDNIYIRQPFMNVEMHYGLVEDWIEFSQYYNNPWKRAVALSEHSHEYRFSWEDFYIYMIVHIVRHFKNGGVGIRSIIDLWLFEQQDLKLNWKYIHTELDKLDLDIFSEHLRTLTRIWFEGEKNSKLYDDLTQFIVESGVFGTSKHACISQIAAVNSRAKISVIKSWIIKIFPPFYIIGMQYPYLKKYPFFIGIAWMQRIYKLLFLKREHTKEMTKYMLKSKSDASDIKHLFANLGLVKND